MNMTHLEGELWKLYSTSDETPTDYIKPPATRKQMQKIASLGCDIDMALKLIKVKDLDIDEANRYIKILESALSKLL